MRNFAELVSTLGGGSKESTPIITILSTVFRNSAVRAIQVVNRKYRLDLGTRNKQSF